MNVLRERVILPFLSEVGYHLCHPPGPVCFPGPVARACSEMTAPVLCCGFEVVDGINTSGKEILDDVVQMPGRWRPVPLDVPLHECDEEALQGNENRPTLHSKRRLRAPSTIFVAEHLLAVYTPTVTVDKLGEANLLTIGHGAVRCIQFSHIIISDARIFSLFGTPSPPPAPPLRDPHNPLGLEASRPKHWP